MTDEKMSLNRAKLKLLRDIKNDEKLAHYVEKFDRGLPFSSFSVEPAITVPIKPEVFKQMRKSSVKKQTKKHPCIVSLDTKSAGIDSKTLNDLTLRSVESMFKTKLDNVNVNIIAAIDCLVLCENNESFTQVLNLETKPGLFGSMLLILPIGKATTEAVATIKYKTETIVHQLKPNSLMAVSGPKQTQGRQDMEVKPANGGRCAILIFHLVWSDAIQLSNFIKPDALSMFIKAASEAHEALKAWIQPQSSKNKAPTPLATSKKGQKLSTTSQKSSKSTLSPQVDAATTKFLCFPLLNDYSPYDIKLEKLQGVDLFISHVLKSIDYLDVHIAVLSCPRKGYRPIKTRRHLGVSILKRRVSQRSIIELPVAWSSSRLNFTTVALEKQLVWSITSQLTKPSYKGRAVVVPRATSYSDEHYDDYSDEESRESDTCIQSVRPGNVRGDVSRYDDSPSEMETIWNMLTKQKTEPKTYSTSDLSSEESSEEEEYYDDGFHKYSICSRCELEEKPGTEHAVLLIKPKWNRASTINTRDAVEDLKSRLNSTLSQIAAGTLAENDSFISDFERLVSHMCSTKELFQNLDVLSMATRLRKLDAGIEMLKLMADNKRPSQDVDPVPYLTDFIMFAGWESCSEHVLGMVDISDSRFAFLGKQLFYLRCLEGAAQLAEKIIEKISTGNHKQHPLELIASIAELVCLLEAEVASKTRYASLLNYLKKHDMDTLRRVFALARESALEKELLSKLLADMSDSFASVRLNEIQVPSFVSIMKEYGHCKGNSKVVESLMKQVFDEVESKQPNTFLHRLIIRLKSDEDYTEVLKQMTRYPKAASKALDLVFESFARHYHNPRTVNEDDIFTQLLSYLQFLSLAENEKQLTSQKRLGLIEKLLIGLGPNDRLSLVAESRRKANRKQFTVGENKFFSLYLQVITRCPIEDFFEGLLPFSDIFDYFLWFKDKALIDSLVHKLANEKDDCDGYLLLDCFRSLFTYSEKLATLERRHISTLLKAWARIACQLDPVVLNEHIPLIFKAYYKAEKEGATDAEIPVFIHQMLPQVDTNSLMYLAVRIEDKQRLKKLTTCFNVFKEICTELSKRANFSQVCLDREAANLERLIVCFLWLGDEKPVSELFKILTSIAPNSKLHKTKLNILKSAELLEATKKSSFALKLFYEVIDDYVKKMNDMLKTPATWALRNAVVPREPKVQQFLRDNTQYHFFSYKTKQGAEGFGKRITSFNLSWALQYTVKMITPGEYRCEIAKTLMFPGEVPYVHGVTNELPKLIELKKTLHSSSGGPASKRVKV